MLKKWIFLCSALALALVAVQGQNNSRHKYIKKYKKIAIKEMERAGVPASIKLAQGILESDAGRSTLARKANNHFGMKCGRGWTGKKYYLEDDDYNDDGELIKSCFRVFKNARASYIAHSEFLRDPNKRYRYGFLFNLNPTNYKAWARGLKKAGYATSPTYAEKLIRVIEEYDLDDYDREATGKPPKKDKPPKNDDDPQPDDPEEEEPAVSARIIKVNGIKVFLADGEQSMLDIAQNREVPVKQMLGYNEKFNQRDAVPPKDYRVFLQRKRDGYRGRDKKYHTIRNGETLFDLSQRYGIKIAKLRKRNRLEGGEEPANGEAIKLRGWFKVKQKPKLRDESSTDDPDLIDNPLEEDPFNDPDTDPDEDSDFMDDETVDFEEPEQEDFDSLQDELFNESEDDDLAADPEPTGPVFHEVRKGETLYGIARRYGITVDHLKNLNKLATDIISVGQRLRIK